MFLNVPTSCFTAFMFFTISHEMFHYINVPQNIPRDVSLNQCSSQHPMRCFRIIMFFTSFQEMFHHINVPHDGPRDVPQRKWPIRRFTVSVFIKTSYKLLHNVHVHHGDSANGSTWWNSWWGLPPIKKFPHYSLNQFGLKFSDFHDLSPTFRYVFSLLKFIDYKNPLFLEPLL